MGGEWQEVQFGEVVDLLTGHPFKSQHYSNDPKDPRLVGGDNIIQGALRWESIRRWPRNMAEGLDAYKLEAGDIVLAMDRPWIEAGLKRAAIGRDDLPALLIQRTARLRGTARLDTAFLRYVISSREFTQYLLGVQTGTAVPHISPTQIKGFRFLLPPVQVQHAIAHILGTLDDKIELNRRTNETLEEMARAIFKSWFVDFDPVRAKADGRQPAGMDAETAKLFPSEFVDSKLGEIPKGWAITTLDDYTTINPESWSIDTRPAIIKYVDLSNTKWGRIDEVTEYLQADAPSRAQRVLRSGDTIVGTVRPGNGSYALVKEDGLTGSTGFAALRPRRAEYREFVYLAATAKNNIDSLSQLADGGAYPAVRPEVVQSTQAMSSDDEILTRFSIRVRPLLFKMAGNDNESRVLAKLRDTLLPKLLSGEIRVKDAERFMEGIA